ncbi:PspC domain-containing protein [Thalassotalea piscium]|uniref:PspC domain-containing protein n=1 Tax=Thalassotalea piscium TaxID=1230533 RepID=UPI0033066DAB
MGLYKIVIQGVKVELNNKPKVLTRSKHGLVSGTLRGLAQYYNLNLNGLQFVFLIMAFFGVGIILYFVLWISIPSYSKRDFLLTELANKER